MEKEIGRFDKSVEEVVIIKTLDFNEMDFVDVRAYKKPFFPNEELIRTYKGLRVKCDLIPEICKILKKAYEEINRKKQEQKK